MKSTIIVLIACALAFTAVSCKKKTPPPSQKPAVQQDMHARKINFILPADSIVSIDKMSKWLQCNPYLDSLSHRYRDSFAVKNSAQLTRYQETFTKAQDLICVRVGLLGGYDEYLWILRATANPANTKILDSLKLTLFK